MTKVKVIRVDGPDDFPNKPLILYTSMNEKDIIAWAERKGAGMVWIYKLKYTNGDSYISGVLQSDVKVPTS